MVAESPVVHRVAQSVVELMAAVAVLAEHEEEAAQAEPTAAVDMAVAA